MNPNDRIDFFTYAEKVANAHKKKTCGFKEGFKIVQRIGSSSKFGEVYLTEANHNGRKLDAAMKLMPINHRNHDELEYYKKFNKYVLSYTNPHFPLVFFSKTCHHCPFHDLDPGSCYVAFKELADGDLKMWLKKKHTNKSFLSFWAQTCIAGMGLEREKLVHKDLHWGNILFHKIPETNKNKYLHYTYNDHNIYVKAIDEQWVLWDFGKTIPEEPYKRSLSVDMYRIGHIGKWSKEHQRRKTDKMAPMPAKIYDLCSKILKFSDESTYITRHTYFDLLLLLQAEFKSIDATVLLIDPPKPPNEHDIINKNKPFNLTSSLTPSK